MDNKETVFIALKEILMLFGLLTGVGALFAGRYIAAGTILSIVMILYYEEPISRWRKRFIGW